MGTSLARKNTWFGPRNVKAQQRALGIFWSRYQDVSRHSKGIGVYNNFV